MTHEVSTCYGISGFFGFVLGLSAILVGVTQRSHPVSECFNDYVVWPLIVIGIAWVVLNVGLTCCVERPCCAFLSSALATLASLAALGLAIMIWIVGAGTDSTYSCDFSGPSNCLGSGEFVCGQGFRIYRLEDYSTWLQKRLDSTGEWDRVRNCIYNTERCQKLGQRYFYDEDDLFGASLDPLQAGCCLPMRRCGFKYVNATFFNTSNRNATVAKHFPDCTTFSSNQRDFCYNCNTCKAGVLEILQRHWGAVAVMFFIGSLLTCPFSFGAFLVTWDDAHNSWKQGSWKHWGQPVVPV